MITAIEAQKRNKDKVNLYLDGEFACSLTAESVVRARLKIGSGAFGGEAERNSRHVGNRACLQKGAGPHLPRDENGKAGQRLSLLKGL